MTRLENQECGPIEAHTKCVDDIIGLPEHKRNVTIPENESWVVETVSHAIIEVPGSSSIQAEVAKDCLIITHPGASVNIAEENNDYRIVEKVA